MNHIIDSVLLIFNVVVGSSVALECSLHALHNTSLGVDTVIIEFSSVIFLCFILKVTQVLHLVEAGALLVVHVRYEFLPSLQVSDALVRFLLLFPQLDDSVLDLRLLVFLLLRNDYRIHHYVIRLLVGNRAHSR